MHIETLAIADLKVLTPTLHRDPRGWFAETYNRRALDELGIADTFVQDNHVYSDCAWVVRGLHFQAPPRAQGKLVRVLRGAVFDVAVDIRRGSPTYGRHASIILSGQNHQQLWVPPGFAHGYCTLEPETEVLYKVTDHYAPDAERGLAWDDAALGIAWPMPVGAAVLCGRDKQLPQLRNFSSPFAFDPAST